jgi:hypothetical protein
MEERSGGGAELASPAHAAPTTAEAATIDASAHRVRRLSSQRVWTRVGARSVEAWSAMLGSLR